MALSQAAGLVEKAIGHQPGTIIEPDVNNPARDRAKYADPSGEMMKALVWMGKNDVRVRKFEFIYSFLLSFVFSRQTLQRRIEYLHLGYLCFDLRI